MNYAIGEEVLNWQAARYPTGQEIVGKQVLLRRISLEDTTELFKQLDCKNSKDDWLYMSLEPFNDRAGLKDWIKSIKGISNPLYYIMIRRADHIPFGFCSFLNIMPEEGSIEMGSIQVAPKFQRSTLFTEAMFLMADHVFALGYRRYEWKCDALNERSRRAAQRLGFSYEGKFRQARIVKGRNRDTKWFSIIDSDWPSLSKIYKVWLNSDNFDGQGRQKKSLSQMTKPFVETVDPELPMK